jgi:hypothetical protein
MSTDHSRRVTADLDQAWLGGMSLFKRIAWRVRATAGMTTAEYAVGTVAAVAFAAVGKPTRCDARGSGGASSIWQLTVLRIQAC